MDEEDYVQIAVSEWLATRKLKVKGYKDKRREQRQEKVRDKLTAIYKEEKLL